MSDDTAPGTASTVSGFYPTLYLSLLRAHRTLQDSEPEHLRTLFTFGGTLNSEAYEGAVQASRVANPTRGDNALPTQLNIVTYDCSPSLSLDGERLLPSEGFWRPPATITDSVGWWSALGSLVHAVRSTDYPDSKPIFWVIREGSSRCTIYHTTGRAPYAERARLHPLWIRMIQSTQHDDVALIEIDLAARGSGRRWKIVDSTSSLFNPSSNPRPPIA